MTRKRTVLVIGATGHLGQAVTRECIARGYRVTATTRRTAHPALAGLDVTVACGDADHPGQLDAWIAGHDVVVDAAAPNPLSLFVADDRAGHAPFAHAHRRTAALLESVARHDVQLAFISSFTTLPRAGTALAALESQWRHGVYPYFRVKQLMEDMVLAAARTGVRAVALNPTACLGPWEHKAVGSSFVRMVLTQRLPAAMRHVINVIDVRDVAAGVLAALDARRYGIQIALCGHNIAVDELARRIGRLAGVAAPTFVADPRLAAVTAFWMETAWAMTGRAAPDVWRAAPLIADAWPMERGAEQRALGAPIRPLDDTLRDAVRWHLAPPSRLVGGGLR